MLLTNNAEFRCSSQVSSVMIYRRSRASDVSQTSGQYCAVLYRHCKTERAPVYNGLSIEVLCPGGASFSQWQMNPPTR